MKPVQFFKIVLKHFKQRSRRVWLSSTTAHIEFGVCGAEELVALRRALEHALSNREGIRWFELNAPMRRVIIAFSPFSYERGELVEMVEAAERMAGLGTPVFDEEVSEHPADVEPLERLGLELLADTLALGLGFALKFSPLPRSKLAISVASLSAITRSTPRLRQGLDERYGYQRMDLTLSILGSFAEAFAQRPISSFVEVGHKSALLREAKARQTVWLAREAELCGAPTEYLEPSQADARPCPLPKGPIEQYADRGWAVGLGGFAVSFLATRSVQRAFAALFGSLPKPARLGRDVFSAELGRALAARNVLVVDADALRRLDRIDCLVLQGDLVSRGRFRIGRIATLKELNAQRARTLVAELFDAENPVSVREAENFQLGPPRLFGVAMPDSLAGEVTSISEAGGLVLALAQRRRIVAVVEVQVIPQTGITELIQAAHDAQMRVVIASNDPEVLHGIPADDTIAEDDGMRRGVRRLQREGRAVCLVAAGPCAGLSVADVSIGLLRENAPPPWGAHLICEEDLSDVRFLLRACVQARRISKQSVNLALGAATVGALVSAGGLLPLTMPRVIAVVNVASLMAMANGVRGSVKLSRLALPQPRDPTPWHALDPRGVLSRLGSSELGLATPDVIARRVPELAKPSALLEFGSAVTDELFSPLAPLLAAGAGLSAVVGSLGDAGMVGGVVVVNALIGGLQRFRTERRIRLLASTHRRKNRVRRDGEWVLLDPGELVPGDIVLLASGDQVPADCRVLETELLEVDASSLTGESLPVRKGAMASFEQHVADRTSMLYEGTSIASGQVTAVVVAVGDDTEVRRGASATSRTQLESGVEKRLKSLIDLAAPVAAAAAGGLVFAGVLRGRRLDELVGSAVSLAVASVPEGLPLLATAAQLSAAERLSQRGALVRNARSIEALGRVDVLCLDKTGTLTEGRIELSRVSDGEQEQPIFELNGRRLRVLAQALRATPKARHPLAQMDPTDAALLRATAQLAVSTSYGCPGFKLKREHPFEAGRGFNVVLAESQAGTLISIKGAPEALLRRCVTRDAGGQKRPMSESDLTELAQTATGLAKRGLRVLAVAEAYASDSALDLEELPDLHFCGFVAFSDPVRKSAKLALEQLQRAGVRPLMITGDHPSTAEAIATELGLLGVGRVATGAELSAMDDEALDLAISQVSVFARVTPAQKVRVVRALQRARHVVAMAGDGSNDAPALRLADVGIAVGGFSTASARGAADIVLTDERIETLLDAIAEGRAMWASVRDAVSILVGGNYGEIAFTVAGGLFDGRSPLSARQLLLVNLLTDVAPAMAIALRPPDETTLQALAQEGPDVSLGQLLTRDIIARAAVTSLGTGGAWFVGRFTGTRSRASTIALVAMVGTQLGQTLVSGKLSRPVVVTSVGSALLLAAVVQTPGLSRLFGCRPLGPLGWGTAISASALATAASVAVPRWLQRYWEELNRMPVATISEPPRLTEPEPAPRLLA